MTAGAVVEPVSINIQGCGGTEVTAVLERLGNIECEGTRSGIDEAAGAEVVGGKVELVVGVNGAAISDGLGDEVKVSFRKEGAVFA